MREQARRIVRTLRQGTVSPESAKAISVATDGIEKMLDSIFVDFQRDGSDGNPLLIEGDWGSGKSHLSMLCRSLLSPHRLAWINTAVDGRGNSLSHLNRCMSAWLAQLRIEGIVGLRFAIEEERLDIQHVTAWAERNPSDLAFGLRAAFAGFEHGWSRALGYVCAMPDDSRQRDRAIKLFLDVARMIREVWGGGIVLILDETENISREWDIRGRRRAYDTLGALAESSDIKLVLLITSRFNDQVLTDQARAMMEPQWTPRARQLLDTLATSRRLAVPSLSAQNAKELVTRVHDIYSVATGRDAVDADKYAASVQSMWARTATKSTRLLVRLAIHVLDLLDQDALRLNDMRATRNTSPLSPSTAQ